MADGTARVGRGLLLATAAVLVVLVVASVPLFVRPASDRPADVLAGPAPDAVVVLGGGGGERLDAGLRLLSDLDAVGAAPELLLHVPFEAPLVRCAAVPGLPDVGLTCVRPEPFSTSGEALATARLAAGRGWDRLVVVTSTYHLTRTRVLVDRCAGALAPDLDVAYLDAGTGDGPLRTGWTVLQEWASLAAAPIDHAPACR